MSPTGPREAVRLSEGRVNRTAPARGYACLLTRVRRMGAPSRLAGARRPRGGRALAVV